MNFRSLILAGLFASASLPVSAAEFHVAPNGSDSNSGTQESPFATIQRAEKSVSPGDTVLIHGGTYKVAQSQIARLGRGRSQVTYLSKSGTQGKPIRYFAFGTEKPVFDFTEVKPPGSRVTAFHVAGSWLHFKGISVVGVQVTAAEAATRRARPTGCGPSRRRSRR